MTEQGSKQASTEVNFPTESKQQERTFTLSDIANALVIARDASVSPGELEHSGYDLIRQGLTTARKSAEMKGILPERSSPKGPLRIDITDVGVILGEMRSLVVDRDTAKPFQEARVTPEVIDDAEENLLNPPEKTPSVDTHLPDAALAHMLIFMRDLSKCRSGSKPTRDAIEAVKRSTSSYRAGVDRFKSDYPHQSAKIDHLTASIDELISPPDDEAEAIGKARRLFAEGGPMRSWARKSELTPEAAVFGYLLFRDNPEQLQGVDENVARMFPKNSTRVYTKSLRSKVEETIKKLGVVEMWNLFFGVS